MRKNKVVRGHYIDEDYVRHNFHTLTTDSESIYLGDRRIVELVVYDGVVAVACYNNYIKKLTLPNSVGYVQCDLNAINPEDYIGTKIKFLLFSR